MRWTRFSQNSLLRWTLQSELGEAVGNLGKGHRAMLIEIVDVRQKSIEVALSVVSGAYQTSLLSYFTHRDLFPSLMKV